MMFRKEKCGLRMNVKLVRHALWILISKENVHNFFRTICQKEDRLSTKGKTKDNYS